MNLRYRPPWEINRRRMRLLVFDTWISRHWPEETSRRKWTLVEQRSLRSKRGHGYGKETAQLRCVRIANMGPRRGKPLRMASIGKLFYQRVLRSQQCKLSMNSDVSFSRPSTVSMSSARMGLLTSRVSVLTMGAAGAVRDQDATGNPSIPKPRSEPWSITIVSDEPEDLRLVDCAHDCQSEGKASAPWDVQMNGHGST